MSNLMLGLLFPLATLTTLGDNRRASDTLNDLMPGLITLMVVATWLLLIAFGRQTPELLNNLVWICVAFFFGQHTAMAAARKIIAAPPASSVP